jgi:uncharacterized protein (DUF736 family)
MADNSIGALWLNEGKKGEFYSGKLTIGGVTTSIVVFKNDYKKANNHPDFRIYLSNKQDGSNIPQDPGPKELEPF